LLVAALGSNDDSPKNHEIQGGERERTVMVHVNVWRLFRDPSI